MSDKTILSTSAKEEVAYKLADRIYQYEASVGSVPTADAKEIRKHYLDLYAECLYAARGLRDFN